MSNPFEFVPPEIMGRLSALKPYTMVLLKAGPNYASEKTMEIVQSGHLPHLFKLQDEGIICFSMPMTDADSDLAGISVYTLTDKEEVARHAANDPAVKAGIFRFEIASCMGLKGDHLK
jgi:uncharacterized protein YciI